MSTQKLIRRLRRQAKCAGIELLVRDRSKGVLVMSNGHPVFLPRTGRDVRQAKKFTKVLGL